MPFTNGFSGCGITYPNDLQLRDMSLRSFLNLEGDVRREMKRRKEECGEMYNLFVEEVGKLYQTSGKIPAIRHFREVTAASLKEAKDTVEALATIYHWEAPPVSTFCT